jgi:DNA adenine methylase
MEEDLSQAHLRLARVTIEHLPWQECLARYDRSGTLFFLDPPYWRTAGYGGPFQREEYDQLAAAMHALKGRAVLTINDHPDMRRAFAGFRSERVRISYTAGGMHRAKPAGELIYRTW